MSYANKTAGYKGVRHKPTFLFVIQLFGQPPGVHYQMRTSLLLLPLMFVGCRGPDTATQHSVLLDTSPRLIRITDEAIGEASAHGSQLIAEVRGDTADARLLIDELWERHHESFPPDERVHYGPDSRFTEIELVSATALSTSSSALGIQPSGPCPNRLRAIQDLAHWDTDRREQALAD